MAVIILVETSGGYSVMPLEEGEHDLVWSRQTRRGD